MHRRLETETVEPRWCTDHHARGTASAPHLALPLLLTTPSSQIKHAPEAYHLRGGATSGDHIDVLGSTALNEVIGKVVTGAGAEVEENIVSNIREYAKRIDWDAGKEPGYL